VSDDADADERLSRMAIVLFSVTRAVGHRGRHPGGGQRQRERGEGDV
jgi:hypothetical protein